MTRAFSFIFVFAMQNSFAQDSKIKTLVFDSILFSGINPSGELYVVSKNTITRFDKDGTILQTQPYKSSSFITSFDSWHLTQIVTYYRANQHIEVYSPQLDLRNSFSIDSSFAIEPFLIAASTDEKHLWVFDAADVSLKKVNPKTGEVVVDVVLKNMDTSTRKILLLREYQHFLFFQLDTRLLVFNGMGKQIKTIEMPDKASFDFFGEEILLLHEGKIQFIDLFSSEERNMPLPKSFKKVLLTDDRFFGVSNRTIEIFEFRPN